MSGQAGQKGEKIPQTSSGTHDCEQSVSEVKQEQVRR